MDTSYSDKMVELPLHPTSSPTVTKAMDEEEDPHEVRRRIRGKAAKSMKKDEYEDMEEERKRHLERLSNVVLEESVIMSKDEVKVMDVVYEELKKVKSAMPKEEESVLRTRIVSPKELLSEGGASAVHAEFSSPGHAHRFIRLCTRSSAVHAACSAE